MGGGGVFTGVACCKCRTLRTFEGVEFLRVWHQASVWCDAWLGTGGFSGRVWPRTWLAGTWLASTGQRCGECQATQSQCARLLMIFYGWSTPGQKRRPQQIRGGHAASLFVPSVCLGVHRSKGASPSRVGLWKTNEERMLDVVNTISWTRSVLFGRGSLFHAVQMRLPNDSIINCSTWFNLFSSSPLT